MSNELSQPTLADFRNMAMDRSAQHRIHGAICRTLNEHGKGKNEYRWGFDRVRVACLDREQPLPLDPQTRQELVECCNRVAARECISYTQAFEKIAAARKDGDLAELMRPGYRAAQQPAAHAQPVQRTAATIAANVVQLRTTATTAGTPLDQLRALIAAIPVDRKNPNRAIISGPHAMRIDVALALAASSLSFGTACAVRGLASCGRPGHAAGYHLVQKILTMIDAEAAHPRRNPGPDQNQNPSPDPPIAA